MDVLDMPQRIETPASEAELAAFVQEAERPFDITGGGTRRRAGARQLSTQGLTGVILYDPGALTLVAKAGTPLTVVEEMLAAEGQRLAFEPMDHRGLTGLTGAPTLGGAVAANVSGPRRIQAGACRDFLLGVRFVDGMGRIIKNGGRVMKNVTGYDLARLMAGSWGRLGVLSEVSLKTLPAPTHQACLMIDNLTPKQAVKALSRALGSPFEVSGAAHVPAGLADHPVTLLRIEGFEGSVSYRLGQLADLFKDHATRQETDPALVSQMWRWVRDVEAFHDAQGDVWRISCKPSDAPALAQRLAGAKVQFDWGGGLFWALTPPGYDMRAALGAYDGHATLVRGDAEGHAMFQPQAPAVSALSKALKAQFDPKGLFNPGLPA